MSDETDRVVSSHLAIIGAELQTMSFEEQVDNFASLAHCLFQCIEGLSARMPTEQLEQWYQEAVPDSVKAFLVLTQETVLKVRDIEGLG